MKIILEKILRKLLYYKRILKMEYSAIQGKIVKLFMIRN